MQTSDCSVVKKVPSDLHVRCCEFQIDSCEYFANVKIPVLIYVFPPCACPCSLLSFKPVLT